MFAVAHIEIFAFLRLGGERDRKSGQGVITIPLPLRERLALVREAEIRTEAIIVIIIISCQVANRKGEERG